MKRTLVVVAAVVGFATAASAATLTVFTTDTSNVPKNTFTVGETILLKVTGDTQGGVEPNAAIQAQAFWNGALTTTVDTPAGCTGSNPGTPCVSAVQGNWFSDKGVMIRTFANPLFDGNAYLINQANVRLAGTVETSFITMVADAAGSTAVTWGGTLLDFFDIYQSPANTPTGHSFTITGVVPEPTTAGLVVLGLLGLALGGRRRA